MARFDDCLAFVLGPSVEGGTSNNPADRGGLTRSGVTQNTYDLYRHAQGLPQQPVTMITSDEICAVYLTYFWTPCKAPLLPVPLDLCMFDMTVNSGQGNASRNLQRSLGVVADGVVGPATIAAANDGDPMAFASAFIDTRDSFYRQVVANDPTQQRFIVGWLNRNNTLRAACGLPLEPVAP